MISSGRLRSLCLGTRSAKSHSCKTIRKVLNDLGMLRLKRALDGVDMHVRSTQAPLRAIVEPRMRWSWLIVLMVGGLPLTLGGSLDGEPLPASHVSTTSLGIPE
jgi:hypothetical protein